MAIQVSQIDETIAKQGEELSKLAIQVEVFEATWSSYSANVKTAIKTYVAGKITAIKASLDDVTTAVNSIP